MRLSEVADYILNRYGLQASYVDLDGQTLAAVTVPGADESFALLVKQEGSETVELKCGSLAKFFAKQPAFGPGSYMQDPAWVSVDLASPELNERFFYKTLDAAYQSSRPLERPEQEIYLLDQDGGDYQEEAIPKRSARPDFIQASDYTRELTQAGDAASAMIKKMQASYDYLARDRRESNFYYQGMMMADYEDDFPKKLPIRQLHPVYHDLTVSQLRAYFSWRTNFRRGKY
ncbi:TerB N-terminal domain-containing protein, partial [Lactobacillus nasalidis]